MKKSMRKIGDRTGIGFSDDSLPTGSKPKGSGGGPPSHRQSQMESEVDRVNEKIRREAQMMMETRRMVGRPGDILDRLDEYSDRFKDTMKAKFSMNFVSSGEVTTVKKEASVTFVKKPDQ
jgi:hypothetical protein